ncbi:MAG: hypothetical protein APR53_08360 [Methanoculleus sp. SDB]|nr:MAG: hypothetical protein APR53_08360 [Methanoculleus sp. SDB]
MTEDNGDPTIVLREEPEFFEELSEYLDVLSSSTRLRILKSIEHRPKDVREISSDIRTSYENTKKHLDKLLRTGVVKKEAGMGAETSKGVHPVWKYSLIPGGMEAIIRNLGLFSNINMTLSDSDLQARLARVKGMVSGEFSGSRPVVIVVGGPDDGAVYPVQAEEVAFGRHDSASGTPDPKRTVVLSDYYTAVTRITRPHARIVLRDGEYFIEDCGSTGGTFKNAEPLPSHRLLPLGDGDLIDLAKGVKGVRLIFMHPKQED